MRLQVLLLGVFLLSAFVAALDALINKTEFSSRWQSS